MIMKKELDKLTIGEARKRLQESKKEYEELSLLFNKEVKTEGQQESVRRYILEQEGKDVFEYNVFGSPNQKIGDFVQTKMGDFNA